MIILFGETFSKDEFVLFRPAGRRSPQSSRDRSLYRRNNAQEPKEPHNPHMMCLSMEKLVIFACVKYFFLVNIYSEKLKNLRVVVQDAGPGLDLGGHKSHMDCTSSPVS